MYQPQTVTINFTNGDAVTFESIELTQTPSRMPDFAEQFVNRVFKKKSPAMHIVSEEDATTLQEMLKKAGSDAARVTRKVGGNDGRFEIGQAYTIYGNHIAEIEVSDLLVA